MLVQTSRMSRSVGGWHRAARRCAAPDRRRRGRCGRSRSGRRATDASTVTALSLADVGGDQLVERLRAQQRGVAGEHDDRRLVVEVVARDRRHPARCGVTGAALFDLLDERDVRPRRGELGDLRRDLLGVVADDDCGRRRAQPLQGLDDVEDHRPAADHVQRLRAVRAHPRALAGGEHDGRHSSQQQVYRVARSMSRHCAVNALVQSRIVHVPTPSGSNRSTHVRGRRRQ